MQSDLTKLALEALQAWKDAQQATEDAIEQLMRADIDGWLHELGAQGEIRDSKKRADAAWAKANALRDAAFADCVPTSNPVDDCETGVGERQVPTAIDEAVQAFITRYARHDRSCAKGRQMGNQCSCGFDDALAAIQP